MWITFGLLLCFYQLFEHSFWRHPFTAEDPLVNKRCDAKFLQNRSDEETNSSTFWMACGWVKKNKKLCKLFLYELNWVWLSDKDYPSNFVHSKGFYCPEGGEGPVPCPRGTFGPSFWATSINECISCPPHHYGPRESLSNCLPCGPWSQQPLPGQDSCTCLHEGQVFQVTAYYIVYISSHAFEANCVEAICRPLLRQTLMFQPSGSLVTTLTDCWMLFSSVTSH